MRVHDRLALEHADTELVEVKDLLAHVEEELLNYKKGLLI